MILSLGKGLQFLETASSEERISNLLQKSSNQVFRFASLEDTSSMLESSSINSSFERCCS